MKELLEAFIGQQMVEIARGDCRIRQHSMWLSITHEEPVLVNARQQIERDAATYIAGLVNFGRDHGVDPMAFLGSDEVEIVRLALAPISKKGV
jgi:hypothetical protein